MAKTELRSTAQLVIVVFFYLIPLSTADSISDLLTHYGLPTGLLPDSVTSYSLADDGAFTVELEKPCYIQFEYLVYYARSISGTLQLGSITDLKGIQVQKFFLWLDVQEIKVDLPPSQFIYFHVGLITKRLNATQFTSARSCRTVMEPQGEITMLIAE